MLGALEAACQGCPPQRVRFVDCANVVLILKRNFKSGRFFHCDWIFLRMNFLSILN